jgi:hypothetical protein
MHTQTDIKVDRRRRQIASDYRKQGYRVVVPSGSSALPEFLRDCQPDLIAEKDDDHVVIEVKASRALKGSNDLVELADRVAGQDGWRFELVTVRSEPDYQAFLAENSFKEMLRKPTPAKVKSFHCLYLTEVLAYLIRGSASVSDIPVRDKTTLHLARELVYRGVLDQDLLDRIEIALDWQDRTMRRLPQPHSDSVQLAELETICRDIRAQTQLSED